MESNQKNIPFTMRHAEPIRIRTVKVSSRKCKYPGSLIHSGSTNKHQLSTATRTEILKSADSSINSVFSKSTKASENFTNTQPLFSNIQEIEEKSNSDEDSLILELTDLLNKKSEKKQEKKKIISRKTIPKVMSHRVFF